MEGWPPQRRQKRVSTMDGRRRNAWFWRRLRDGLEAINDLPAAAVVCKAVPPSAREIVARHLPAVIAWLRDFEAAWSENPR